MKFMIKHEIPGRIRIHVAQKQMSYQEADALLYYLNTLEYITQAKVYRRTADACVCFTGKDVYKRQVYTSADSVFQIAAHEDVVPLEDLYEYCRIAREILTGEHSVGRVIARPFVGESGNYTRTPHRHDFSLVPPSVTMMDVLTEKGYDTKGVGKIFDIFAGKNVQTTVSIKNNVDGMDKTLEIQKEDFNGLCFVNLVDFDMLYGHRNDIDGYANAATVFDEQLGEFLKNMRDDDVLMITADHGCDPGFKGTDHSRECVPMLMYGKAVKEGVNLGTRNTFSDMAATVLDMFGIQGGTEGTSFWGEVKK